MIDLDLANDEALLFDDVTDLLSSSRSGEGLESAGDSCFLAYFFFEPLSERFSLSIKCRCRFYGFELRTEGL